MAKTQNTKGAAKPGKNKKFKKRERKNVPFGLVFIQGGENHVPAADWLRHSVALGFWPDVRMSTGQFQGARAVDEVLKQLGPGIGLPRHEYEMTHDGGGNRMTPLFTGNGGKALAAMDGRFSVAIDDVKKIAIPVLRHRLSTNFQAQAEGMTTEDVVLRLLKEIKEPEVSKFA